jgi:hypothetical protein
MAIAITIAIDHRHVNRHQRGMSRTTARSPAIAFNVLEVQDANRRQRCERLRA